MSASTPTSRDGLRYALITYGIWGLFPFFFKQVADLNALEVLYHRIVWACAFTALILFIRNSWPQARQHLRNKQLWRKLSLSSALIAVNWWLFIYAINTDQVLASSFGYFLTPLVSILIGRIVLSETLNPTQRVAVLFATMGVAWQIMGIGELPWISLILAITFGYYGLVRKQSDVDTVTGLFMETLILFPILLPYWVWNIYIGEDQFFTSGYDAARLIAMGIITALPLLTFAAAAQRLSLAVLGFMTYLAPTGHLLLAVFLYNEPFGTDQLISFGLIWMALIIFSLGSLVKPATNKN